MRGHPPPILQFTWEGDPSLLEWGQQSDQLSCPSPIQCGPQKPWVAITQSLSGLEFAQRAAEREEEARGHPSLETGLPCLCC